MSEQNQEQQAAANTDRELWREVPGDYYSDSIHVTKEGGIGINCSGRVRVMPLRKWMELTSQALALPSPAPVCPTKEQEVLIWLGFWRDKIPAKAVSDLQDIVGVTPPSPAPVAAADQGIKEEASNDVKATGQKGRDVIWYKSFSFAKLFLNAHWWHVVSPCCKAGMSRTIKDGTLSYICNKCYAICCAVPHPEDRKGVGDELGMIDEDIRRDMERELESIVKVILSDQPNVAGAPPIIPQSNAARFSEENQKLRSRLAIQTELLREAHSRIGNTAFPSLAARIVESLA